jgi:colanic acid biosynthesis glycosyl transferase WcaI
VTGAGPVMTDAAPQRILVVGINYAPENIGTGKYTSEMCAWLAAKGHEVRVVTAPPYYPAWKIWPGYRHLWFLRESIDGADVIRCPLWVPRKPNGIKRMLHLGSFALSSALALLTSLVWRPTHVIAIAPTLASAPAAWLLARLSSARCWLHIQDFELDAALDMGIVDAGPLRRLAMGVERWLLRRFDRVSTISPKMVERLAAKGVDPDRRVLLPNWADIDAIQPLAGPSPYREELGIPDNAVVALYSGNMGLKQGLELLGEAALRLRDQPGLHFVFGGEGPARGALESRCAGLPNVHFLGLQPIGRLNDWLGLADIHLLPQRADVADLVMPSKLTGMLASGRPVLATALPGTGVALAVQDCGTVVAPGDIQAFTAALQSLAGDGATRQKLGDAARQQALTTLARDTILQRFEQALTAP